MKDNAQLCPLCGQVNQCALTQGLEISECWCSQQTFPEKAIAVKVMGKSLSSSDKACLCPQCIARLKEEGAC